MYAEEVYIVHETKKLSFAGFCGTYLLKKRSLNLLRPTAKILWPFAPANNQTIGDLLLVYG